MKTARLASAAGGSVGMETSSSGDVNQLWRIDPLEDGHHGLPLLGAPGQLMLLGSLFGIGALCLRAARPRG
jgi:hypothetical protein